MKTLLLLLIVSVAVPCGSMAQQWKGKITYTEHTSFDTTHDYTDGRAKTVREDRENKTITLNLRIDKQGLSNATASFQCSDNSYSKSRTEEHGEFWCWKTNAKGEIVAEEERYPSTKEISGEIELSETQLNLDTIAAVELDFLPESGKYQLSSKGVLAAADWHSTTTSMHETDCGGTSTQKDEKGPLGVSAFFTSEIRKGRSSDATISGTQSWKDGYTNCHLEWDLNKQ